MIAFGSSPGLHPDAVLLERADDERVGLEAERGPGGVAPGGVDEREAVELDPDRDPVHARRVDARGNDEELHLAMGHLDPVEAVGVPRERLVGAVELGEARRPRAAVEVRHPEPMGRARPARVERREVARVEDDLPPCEPRPRGRAERVARLARDGGHVRRLVVERPAERVAEDEESRAVGPVTRPARDRGPRSGVTTGATKLRASNLPFIGVARIAVRRVVSPASIARAWRRISRRRRDARGRRRDR